MRRITRLILLLFFAIVLTPQSSKGQSRALGTNAIAWLELGSINAEAEYAISKNYTINVKGEWNPFMWQSGGNIAENKRVRISAGARLWPWFVYSGWFINSYATWIKYGIGGLFSDSSYEGIATGLSFGGGYALMLTKGLNIEMGAGAFAGATKFTKYSCTRCGSVVKRENKLIVLPSDLLLQLSMIF